MNTAPIGSRLCSRAMLRYTLSLRLGSHSPLKFFDRYLGPGLGSMPSSVRSRTQAFVIRSKVLIRAIPSCANLGMHLAGSPLLLFSLSILTFATYAVDFSLSCACPSIFAALPLFIRRWVLAPHELLCAQEFFAAFTRCPRSCARKGSGTGPPRRVPACACVPFCRPLCAPPTWPCLSCRRCRTCR